MSNEQRLRKNFYDAEPLNEMSVFGLDDAETDAGIAPKMSYGSRSTGRIVARMPDLDEQEEFEQPATIPFLETPEGEFSESPTEFPPEASEPAFVPPGTRCRRGIFVEVSAGVSAGARKIRDWSRPARRAVRRVVKGTGTLLSGQLRNLGIAVVLCVVVALMWGAFGPRDRDRFTEPVAYKALTQNSDETAKSEPQSSAGDQGAVQMPTPPGPVPATRPADPKPEVPGSPVPKPADPVTEVAPSEAPLPETFRADAPKTEEIPAEVLVMEASKPEAPKTDAPRPDSPWARQPDSNYFPWGMASTRDHDSARTANETPGNPGTNELAETLPPPNMDSIHSIFGMESGQASAPENGMNGLDPVPAAPAPMGFAGYVPPDNVPSDDFPNGTLPPMQGTLPPQTHPQNFHQTAQHPQMPSQTPSQVLTQAPQQPPHTATGPGWNSVPMANVPMNGQAGYPRQYPQAVAPSPQGGAPAVQYLPAPERQQIAAQESPQTFRSHPQSIPAMAARHPAQAAAPQNTTNPAYPPYVAHAAPAGTHPPVRQQYPAQPQGPYPQQAAPQQTQYPQATPQQVPQRQSQARPYQPPLAESWVPSQALQNTRQQGTPQGYQTVPPTNVQPSGTGYPAGYPTTSPGVALPSTPGYY